MAVKSGAKRVRRSFVQLLSDYQENLRVFDDRVARQRAKLVGKIEKLEARYSLIALGMETLGQQTPEEAEAALEAQLKELRLRRRALKRVSKIA